MRRVTVIATAAVLVLMAVFTLTVAAQQPDTRDRTIMTFSSAVELPGLRLEPGTYVFRLADTATRNVIQVLSQDEVNMLGQWLYVPAERQEVSGDTVVTFREASANATPAVQFWYYPGEKTGKEFIYPKDQAMRIAARTGGAVMTEGGPVTAGGAQASASVQTDTTQGPSTARADAQIAPAQEQGAVAVEGTGRVEGSGLPGDTQARTTVGTSGSAGVTASAQDTGSVRQESTVAQAELPATASPLALSGLIGLLSLAGAFGIRAFRL
jgi:hypothetical protein